MNNGILQRRMNDWNKAMMHFSRAVTIDPTYCDPLYWMGLTLINTGLQAKLRDGVAYLEQAVECKYTRAEAVTALNLVRTPPRIPLYTRLLYTPHPLPPSLPDEPRRRQYRAAARATRGPGISGLGGGV